MDIHPHFLSTWLVILSDMGLSRVLLLTFLGGGLVGSSLSGGVKGPWTGRDSYLNAADHSTGLKSPSYYYNVYPQYLYGQQKVGTDEPYGGLGGLLEDEADAKVDPLSIGGVLGVAKAGVSSLGWVTTGIVAIILAPILLPIILAPLILIGLLIYFIPVIRLDLGPDGAQVRRTGSRMGEAFRHLEVTGRLLYSLSANEECLERVACEMGRASSLSSISKWIQAKLDRIENPMVKRLSRVIRLTSSPVPNCKMFGCDPKRQLRRLLMSTGQEGK